MLKWTKGDRKITNDTGNGVLNVTIASVADFGVYTCHAITSEGQTNYSISVCQQTAPVEAVMQGKAYRKNQFVATRP